MTARLLRIAAAALSLLALGSCGDPRGKVPEGAVRIQIWQAFNTEETAVFREIMNDFEKEWESKNGKNLIVDLQYVAYNDMFTKLKTAAMADITPDVAFLDAIKVTDMSFGKGLVRLDELESFKRDFGTIETAREQFVGASFDAGLVNRLGETGLYGFPVQTTTVSLFWNREIFRNKATELRAAGLDPNRAPRDWDEMVAYGKVLTDTQRGVYAFGTYGSLWFNFPFFNMYGVGFVKYDEQGVGHPDIDTPNGIAAMTRILAIVNSGVEGGAWKRSALGPDAGFLNRNYAMALSGPWNVENVTNAGLDFDVALIPAPTQAEIDALGLPPSDPELVESLGIQAWSSSNVGGQTGVILRSSKDPDLAFQMLSYFTSEPVQRRWSTTLGQIPVRLAAWENLDMTKYPYVPKFMLQLRLAKRIPQIPLYGTLESDVFNPQIDLLLQNRQTPAEMVEKMEASMQRRILDRINEAAERTPR